MLDRQNRQLKKEVGALKTKIVKAKRAEGTADFVPSGSASVMEAYGFAQENIGVLRTLDCYCSCQDAGDPTDHKNLAECFIKAISAEGKIIYEPHGQGCQICVNEVMETKTSLAEGKNLPEIKNFIDEKYGY